MTMTRLERLGKDLKNQGLENSHGIKKQLKGLIGRGMKGSGLGKDSRD